MNNTDTRFDNLDATCRSLILEEIKKLNNEGFDTSHYIVDGGWTQEEKLNMSSNQYLHIPSNWYISNWPWIYDYAIALDNLTNEIIDDLVISFNYDNFSSIWLTMQNTALDIDLNIDKLLAKLDGLQKLIISDSVGNIKITRFPQTLINLINYSTTSNISNLPDTLQYYNFLHKQNTTPIIIPELPAKNIMLQLEGKCLTNSFYSLPSLITDITINVSYLDFDIDMWPMNLENLTIEIGIYNNRNYDNTSSFGVLPYGLKSFKLEAGSYNHPFDMPPTLEKFSFITYEEYPYSECFDNLPDSIKTIMVSYKTFPDITKLPKKCKTFIYMKCPNDVFKSITKNKQFKGISISKKKQNNF